MIRVPQPGRPLQLLCLYIGGLVHTGAALAQNPVHFPDQNLKAAVEDALWISDPTPADMRSLREFSCIKGEIKDITGLEFAGSLQTLWLTDNQISDISALSGMNSLRKLVLNNNQISDLSPLSGLSHLQYLDLHENQISDVSALAGLDNLQVLVLRINQLSDISPLSALTDLRELDLRYNQLVDISPLSEMAGLRDLYLRGNQIEDISPLGNLANLTRLYLGYNEISSISALSGLTDLRELYIRGNQITDISALVGLTTLQTLDMRWNPLSQDLFCSYLSAITENNPGIITFHDDDCATSTSSATAPVVDREPVTDIGANSAVLQARVMSDGDEACEGRFRYWIPDEDENKTAWQSSLHSDAFFGQEITGLQPDTSYIFVAELRNTAGIDVSSTGQFATLKGSYTLSVLSSPGGTVVDPGQGDFICTPGTSLPITAQALGQHALFVGWTGSAVEADRVKDPYALHTSVLVDSSYTLQANFLEQVIYVDDDAPHDPGPRDLSISDPQEDGSPDHPYDAIQEAIGAAPPGALVLVRPGVYPESLNLLGKGIHVTGIDPSHPEIEAWPVITGNGRDSVVTFAQGEDGQCQLSGLVLTGGRHAQGAAVACVGSSPSVRNCLIVGNRCAGQSGAIIDCQNASPLFENLTVHGNDAGATGVSLRFTHCRAEIVNSILWGNLPEEIGVVSGEAPLVSYCNVMGTWPGLGNMGRDPQFARPGRWTGDPGAIWTPGDYHLMSSNGCWDPDNLSWAQDGLISPCVDAGHPDWPYALEPVPHGKRINMGAYGGTIQASRSSMRLLAHWPFDETSGDRAVDAVGYHDGIVHGAAWSTGRLNGALHFDGIDDCVDCGSHLALAPDRFTICLWLYPQASSASRTVLQKGGIDSEDYGFELFGAQYPTFSFGQGADRIVLFSDDALTGDEWTHVGLRRDRDSAALFVNGTQALSKAYGLASPATDHPLVIGGADASHFQGKLDDLRIYGLPLSAEDIRGLMDEE